MYTLTIGCSPWGEDCAQVGRPGYGVQAEAECEAFKAQLLRVYEAAKGKLPKGVTIKVQTHPHDFGDYFSVDALYEDTEEACEAVSWIDDNVPEEWDEEARATLFAEEG